MIPLRTHRLALAGLLVPLAALGACANVPTLESIKYGYSPSRVTAAQETPIPDDYNDMAAGWAPERDPEQEPPPLYGRDGTPVGASAPGQVTQTARPINDGVDPAPAGTRSVLLDMYAESNKERERLQVANEDLEMALRLSEQRAQDLEQQLLALQAQYDQLGAEKQTADQRCFDLAARLATAQIARLEAERALLQATIEWRRMSRDNNRALTGPGSDQ